MLRNFECLATGKPCERGECKKGFCILEHPPVKPGPTYDVREAVVIESDDAVLYHKEAKVVVRDWLRWAKFVNDGVPVRRLTKEQVEKVSQLPVIVEEAKRRAKEK